MSAVRRAAAGAGRKAGSGAGLKQFQVDLPRSAFRRLNRGVPVEANQPGKEELAVRLRQFALFASLPPRVLADLVASASVRAYRTGDVVWRRGEQDTHAIFIEAGFVKAARRNAEGVSRTYGLYGPGDSMGIFAIWSGMKYPTDAIAMNDGLSLILVEAAAILRFSEKFPRLAEPLHKEMTRFADAFINKIEIVSAGTVPQRLAVMMAQLVDRYGVEKKGARALLPMGLTLEQVREIVGARLETVARTLGEWKRAGWLHIDATGVHFDRLDLVRALCPA